MKEKKAAAQAAILDYIAANAERATASALRDMAEAYSYVKDGDPLAPPKRGGVF